MAAVEPAASTSQSRFVSVRVASAPSASSFDDMRWKLYRTRRRVAFVVATVAAVAVSASIKSDGHDGVVWASTIVGRALPIIILGLVAVSASVESLVKPVWDWLLAALTVVGVASVQMLPLVGLKDADLLADCDTPGCRVLFEGQPPWLSLGATFLGSLLILTAGGSWRAVSAACVVLAVLFAGVTVPELDTAAVSAAVLAAVIGQGLLIAVVAYYHDKLLLHVFSARKPVSMDDTSIDLLRNMSNSASCTLLHLSVPSGTVRHVSLSAQKVSGRHPSSLIGMPLSHFVKPSDQSKVDRAFHNATVHQPIVLQYSRTAPGGGLIPVQFTGFVTGQFEDASGVVGWETLVTSDTADSGARPGVTPARANAALHDRVRRFVHHELRNALHALTFSAGSIAELTEVVDNAEARDDINDLVSAATSTRLLVDDLLTVAKMQDGTVMTVPEVTSLPDAVAEVVRGLQPVSPCPIKVYISAGVPAYATLDPEHMKKLLSMILAATVKSNQETSAHPIAVHLIMDSDQVLKVTVVDSGSPIHVKSMAELQLGADDSTQKFKSARAQRLAMTLPLLQHISGLLMGELGANQSSNKMVRVWFTAAITLPSAEETSALVSSRNPTPPFMTHGPLPEVYWAHSTSGPVPMPDAPAPKRKKRQRKPVGLNGQLLNLHVLLVDDVSVIRRQGETFLQRLGCTCVCLEDGDEIPGALRSSQRPFDAILLDIMMGRSDGADVCNQLRRDLKVRCPIIAMTSHTRLEEKQRYYKMGFDVVLAKPFTLVDVGRALLEGQGRRGDAPLLRMSAVDGTAQPVGSAVRSTDYPAPTPAPAGAGAGAGSSGVAESKTVTPV